MLGRRLFLIEPEVDGEIEQNVDLFSVQRAGLEFPLLHRVNGGLIEAERERLENGDVLHETVAPDDHLQDDDAADLRLPRLLGVQGLDLVDCHRRSDITAHTDRGGVGLVLIELEVEGEGEDDVDRFAVDRGRFEDPLLHRIDGRLGQAVRQTLEDLDVLHGAGVIDDRLQNDNPADAFLPRFLRVDRIHVDDRHGRFDVATDAIGLSVYDDWKEKKRNDCQSAHCHTSVREFYSEPTATQSKGR